MDRIPYGRTDISLPVDGLSHAVQYSPQQLLGDGNGQLLAHANDLAAYGDALHLVVGHDLHGPVPQADDLSPDDTAAVRKHDLAQLSHNRAGAPGLHDQSPLNPLHHAGILDGINSL
jgi:hypothetical protein